MTPEEIENAYATVQTVEKKLLEDLTSYAEEVQAKLKSIKDSQPTAGSNSAARQFLTRVENALNQVFSYDLQNVRATYGINTTNAVSAPAYTPVA